MGHGVAENGARKWLRAQWAVILILGVGPALLALWFVSRNTGTMRWIEPLPSPLAQTEDHPSFSVSVSPGSRQYIQVTFNPEDGAIERGLLSGRGTVKNISPTRISFLVLGFTIGDGQEYMVDPQMFSRIAPGEEREFTIVPMRITGSLEMVFAVYGR